MLGWQAFSLTNVSTQASGVGNPLANLRTEEAREPWMQHRRVFSYRGLLELMADHGFADIQILGAGYYPLPTSVAHADPRHAAFLTVAGRRPFPALRGDRKDRPRRVQATARREPGFTHRRPAHD